MKFIRKLPEPKEIIDKFPLSSFQAQKRQEYINQIKDIISGKSSRKLLCIGPCSADQEDAVVSYMLCLAKMQEKVQDKFFIVPRIYTSKPRTEGTGYKGLLHRPSSDSEKDNLLAGIIASRKMHLHIIQQTGMYGMDEMLYPESLYYILDLLSYVAIGARSVEDQGHRLVASGLEVPVGMKNPTSGDTNVLFSSIAAAHYPQSMIYQGWEVQTEGNPFTHGILRGYVDGLGKSQPNYHYENLCAIYDQYQKKSLKNMAIIIDCNHNNSGKNYYEQVRISKEIISICAKNEPINQMVKGIMIESYLEDGNQLIGGGIFGKSITDSCLGWEKTEKLVMEL